MYLLMMAMLVTRLMLWFAPSPHSFLQIFFLPISWCLSLFWLTAVCAGFRREARDFLFDIWNFCLCFSWTRFIFLHLDPPVPANRNLFLPVTQTPPSSPQLRSKTKTKFSVSLLFRVLNYSVRFWWFYYYHYDYYYDWFFSSSLIGRSPTHTSSSLNVAGSWNVKQNSVVDILIDIRCVIAADKFFWSLVCAYASVWMCVCSWSRRPSISLKPGNQMR